MTENNSKPQEFEMSDFNRFNPEDECIPFNIDQIIGENLEENEIFEELMNKIAKEINESI